MATKRSSVFSLPLLLYYIHASTTSTHTANQYTYIMVQGSDILLIIVAILFPPAAAAFITGCSWYVNGCAWELLADSLSVTC